MEDDELDRLGAREVEDREGLERELPDRTLTWPSASVETSNPATKEARNTTSRQKTCVLKVLTDEQNI